MQYPFFLFESGELTVVWISDISAWKERSNIFLPLSLTYPTTHVQVVRAFPCWRCFHFFSMFRLKHHNVGLCLADNLGQPNLLFRILPRHKWDNDMAGTCQVHFEDLLLIICKKKNLIGSLCLMFTVL